MNNRDRHARFLRKGRRSLANQIYHVSTRCYKECRIFESSENAGILLQEIDRSDQIERTNTIIFIAMPDHMHWLFTLRTSIPLEKLVRQIKGRSSKRINAATGSSGRLWQPGFYDRAIRRTEDVAQTALYILGNPVRAGLVSSAWDYPFLRSVYKDTGRG
ncbi:MAG: transposase [Chromatiales bacterium]|jgi:REP element-mobilizing transposase RayT|nr:transposase [Chromatiales bacterium]